MKSFWGVFHKSLVSVYMHSMSLLFPYISSIEYHHIIAPNSSVAASRLKPSLLLLLLLSSPFSVQSELSVPSITSIRTAAPSSKVSIIE